MANDLALTSPVYAAGRYGNALTGGIGSVSGVLPGQTFSARCVVKTTNAGSIKVAFAQTSAFWIGIDASNKAHAEYGSGGTGVVLNTTVTINDNVLHELRLDVSSSGGTLYVDGVVAASSATTGAGAVVQLAVSPLAVRRFGSNTGFDWPDLVDEAVLYSAAPTTQGQSYTPFLTDNNAANAVGVWHLDSNGTNSLGLGGGASQVYMWGPATCVNGSASTAFTVAANGTITGTVVVTPSDSGAGGTFTPSTVSISSGTPTATFTYTASSTGAKSLSLTNNGGLTNPAALVTTAGTATSTTFAVDDTGLYWSPYNWDLLEIGDYAVSTKSKQTACCGAYLQTKVTGTTTLVLNIDTSTWGALSATPLVQWVINGGTAQTTQPTSGATQITLATGLTSGSSYDVRITLLGTAEATGTRWGANSSTSPTNILRINGLVADLGAALSAPTLLLSNYAVFFGDSIDEGTKAAGTTTQPADHAQSYGWFVGPALGCEYGVIGFGSQGWQQSGAGSMPAFPSAWNLHSTGRTRSFSPAPSYAFVRHGTNGATAASDVSTWLTSARAAFGATCWIFVVVPQGGFAAATLATGVTNYQAGAPSDTKVALIDVRTKQSTVGLAQQGTASYKSVDGLHPYAWHNGAFASAVVQAAQAAIGGIGGTSTSGTVVIDLGGVGLTNTGGMVVIA